MVVQLTQLRGGTSTAKTNLLQRSMLTAALKSTHFKEFYSIKKSLSLSSM